MWEKGQSADGEEQGDTTENEVAGVWIELRYEKMSYTALLLRNPSHAERRAGMRQEADGSDEEGEDESYLPLLLMHMPSPLRSTLQDYLTTTFDTRIEEIHLSSPFIAFSLEVYLADISPVGAGSMVKLIKDLPITLAFRGPVAPSLRMLDVMIRREDVLGLLIKGKGMATGKDLGAKSPFMTALSAYLKAHLALDMAHEDVGVSKVACGSLYWRGREGLRLWLLWVKIVVKRMRDR